MMIKREEGTTLIEALMAIVVLVVGVIGTFTAFDGARELGMLTEKKQSAARFVQSEIESMRNMGWTNLKLNATPAAFSDTRGTVAGGNYTPPRPSGAPAQPLVVSSTPASCTATTCVNPGPEAWTYGSASGFVYRYITSSHDDACPAPRARRHHRPPADHRRRDDHRTERPEVRDRQLVDRGRPVGGADGRDAERQPGHVDGRLFDRRLHRDHLLLHRHAGRRHLRGTLGQPHGAQHDRLLGVPDSRRVPATPGSGQVTAYSYSTDSPPLTDGGLGLASSASCNGTTATTAHRWVTPVINSSAAVTATGNAALSMPTSLLSGNVAAGAPGQALHQHLQHDAERLNQAPAARCSAPTPTSSRTGPKRTEFISFPFRYLATGTTTSLAAGKRLMVELTARQRLLAGHGARLRPPELPGIDPAGDAVMKLQRPALAREDGFAMYIVVMSMMVLLTLGAALRSPVTSPRRRSATTSSACARFRPRRPARRLRSTA